MNHYHQPSNEGFTLAFWMNLLFSVIEAAGGILTNSTAIVADAFHDFADALAIGVASRLEKLSTRTRTAQFSYGYRRFSLLAALGMSLFLLVGALFMTVQAIELLIHPVEVNERGMFWLAVLGVGMNSLAFLKIKNGSVHSGHHLHSHSHNERAIMLHLLEDVLGWGAVLVGAVIIHFTGWYRIDGVLTLAIATFTGYNATGNLVGTFKVMLQSVPPEVDLNTLSEDLRQIEGVQHIHDVHVWSLDGHYHVGTLHVRIGESWKAEEERIHREIVALMTRHHIHHPTVQMETGLRNCSQIHC